MTNDIGKTLTLQGKTRHGKERIATHGEQWTVMRDDVNWRGNPAWAVVSMDMRISRRLVRRVEVLRRVAVANFAEFSL